MMCSCLHLCHYVVFPMAMREEKTKHNSLGFGKKEE
jgi:hypothetical protein